MRKKIISAIIVLGVVLIMITAGIGKLRWKLDWEPEKSAETGKFLANSERGFYNMRGVIISDEKPLVEQAYESIRADKSGGTLELLQIHIGAYTDGSISDSGLAQIRGTFEAYGDRETPAGLIVRFLYDWDGQGALRDPASLDIVLGHMEQLGEIVNDYEDQIYIVQGVIVGSWAEMHSSRYLTKDSYLKLIAKMHEVMPDSVYLAVRTPAYWRMAAGTKDPLDKTQAWDMDRLASRLSLFNDGMLGNSLDCGTYGDISRESSSLLTDKWTREDELAFQNELCMYVPNGGEAVLDNRLNDLEEACGAFGTMHVSYLNMGHDTEVLDKWKNTIYQENGSVYDGMSGYDYIERHLGYRFVISGVSVKAAGWRWEDPEIRISIENTGYAPRYTPCTVQIIIEEKQSGRVRTITPDTDVRTWRPGETVTITASPELDENGEYEVWLNVTGEKDKKAVLFANENETRADGSCLLGTLRKGVDTP